MRKIIIIYFVIIAFLIIPHHVQATNTNMIQEQLQQETNEIMGILEEQKNNQQATNSLIIELFTVVIISMIFENIVKTFKYTIKEKNQKEEETKELKKKLWITYGIHGIILLIFFLVCKFALKVIDLYNLFFVLISVCMVEIGPFLQIRMKKKNRRKDDITH